MCILGLKDRIWVQLEQKVFIIYTIRDILDRIDKLDQKIMAEIDDLRDKINANNEATDRLIARFTDAVTQLEQLANSATELASLKSQITEVTGQLTEQISETNAALER